ncbi:V-type ATP synthase subunit F [bacterium]|nr:V-type ATP synthase subunit F [bacterium]
MSWNKIAAIGDWSTVFPLKAIGIEAHSIAENDDAAKLLRHLANSKEFGIIFVQENLLERIHPVMEEFLDKDLPAIILIPSVSGSEKLGISIIRDTMKKAAGRDILAEE